MQFNKIVFLAIMFATAIVFAGEKHIFQGYVVDPMGNAVLNASVEIPALGISTKTDSTTGLVKFEIMEGEYLVVVKSKGFENYSENYTFDHDVMENGFEFVMEYEAKEVVVTGTKTEKLIEEAPVKTTVLTKSKIEKKMASTVADALEQTTGIRVENDCQNCGFNQVRLNGLDGHYTQILIDSKAVYSSLAGVYGLEHIPTEMIERIEIVKGGGSALYGGNAIGGVINVITKRPQKQFFNTTIETQLMPQDGDDSGIQKGLKLGANAGLVSKGKKAAAFVYAGGFARQAWDDNNDGFSDIGEAKQVYGGGNTYLTLFDTGELSTKFNLMREKRRGGDSLDKADHKAEVSEGVKTDRWQGEVKWKQELGLTTNYQFSYGFAYTERLSYYGGADEFGDMYGKTQNPMHVLDASIDHQFNFLGTMIVTAGFQYSTEDLNDYDSNANSTTDETYTNLAGLLQLDWYTFKWMEIILGARVDKHSELDDPVFSPRAVLLLSPFSGFKLRTSFSTGFRAPQIFDEDFHITVVQGEPSPTYNSDDLEAEKSWNISQQFEYQIKTANNFTIKPSVNGFFTKIYDAFATRDIEEGEQYYEAGKNGKIRYNSGTTTVKGIEAELSVKYAKIIEFETGWTFEKAENEEADEDLTSVGIEEKDILRTPEIYGYVSLSLMPVKGLELNTSVDITGPMKIKHEGDFNGSDFELKESSTFARWDFEVAYKHFIDKDIFVKPYIGMKNILNSFQDDLDKGAERDAGYVYGPRVPRTFVVGLKAGF